jgi:hypothetical protein
MFAAVPLKLEELWGTLPLPVRADSTKPHRFETNCFMLSSVQFGLCEQFALRSHWVLSVFSIDLVVIRTVTPAP